MTKRILIVDDEPDICEILRFNLEMEGYEVQTSEGPIAINEPIPDLILLDVMMTPKSGFEWAAELKSQPLTAQIPIIFCTAKTMEEDLLYGFALGSDDYICKPFRVSEVKARVKAVLMRTAQLSHINSVQDSGMTPTDNTPSGLRENVDTASARNIIEYEGIALDLDRKECLVDGKEVAFTKLEFELLALLLSRPGQVFSREKILQSVWPSDAIVLDRTVDVNITRIRKKIGPYGECLRTKFGYGYMFSDIRK